MHRLSGCLVLLVALAIGAPPVAAQYRSHRTVPIAAVFNATEHPVEFQVRFSPGPPWQTEWLQPGQTRTLTGPETANVCEVGVSAGAGRMRTYRLPFDRVSIWRRPRAEGPVQSFVRHGRELRLVPGRAPTGAESAVAIAQGVVDLVSTLSDLKHGHRIQAANNSGAPIRLYLTYRPGGGQDWKSIGTWVLQPGECSFLAHEDRLLRTKNSVIYFFAEDVQGPRIWDGALSVQLDGRALKMREYRREPDADGILRLPIDP